MDEKWVEGTRENIQRGDLKMDKGREVATERQGGSTESDSRPGGEKGANQEAKAGEQRRGTGSRRQKERGGQYTRTRTKGRRNAEKKNRKSIGRQSRGGDARAFEWCSEGVVSTGKRQGCWLQVPLSGTQVLAARDYNECAEKRLDRERVNAETHR